MSDVFKALADNTRRLLLDELFKENGQTLTGLCTVLGKSGQDISRQGVSKHLHVLEEANLIAVHWQGREKLHYLNPVPLAEIVHRWVGRFEDARLEMLTDLKVVAEAEMEKRNGRQG